MFRKYFLNCIIITFLILLFFSCSFLTESEDSKIQPITLDSVYYAGITNLVKENIWLETKLTWYTGRSIWEQDNDTIYVDHLTVLFENSDEYIPEKFKGEQRGNMLVTSEYIYKKFNDKEQEYYFNDVCLEKGINYYLYGYFDYRKYLNIDSTNLSDSVFIEQSNDVTYWSQTFEFKFKNIICAFK